MTKVKGTLSDFRTASGAFAKVFGKTYVEESGKYANTLFGGAGTAATSVKIAGEAFTAGVKDAKSALRMVKVEENGFIDQVGNLNKKDLHSKYIKDSFLSQDEFKNFMDSIFKDDLLTGSEKAFINRGNFAKLIDAQKSDLNTLGNDKFLKIHRMLY